MRGGKRSTSFKPGNRANPGGRPKAVHSLTELARAHTEDAIAALADIMNNSQSDPARATAASHILDRGLGQTGADNYDHSDRETQSTRLDHRRAGRVPQRSKSRSRTST